MSSLMEKLKEKKANSDMMWHPEEGDIIEGQVIEMGKTITTYGDAEFIKIVLGPGKIKMLFLNASLQRQVNVEDVQEGDTIAIEYLGEKQGSGKHAKRKFKEFNLVKADPEDEEDAPSDN